jgi:predicted GNAT family acetyltransferase
MPAVVDNPDRMRFELAIEGSRAVAAAYYRMSGAHVVLTHTIVPDEASGQGVGSKLARGVLDQVRASGRKAILVCPFMASFYERHPEYADVIDDLAGSGDQA